MSDCCGCDIDVRALQEKQRRVADGVPDQCHTSFLKDTVIPLGRGVTLGVRPFF
jgi:hypothetical protein